MSGKASPRVVERIAKKNRKRHYLNTLEHITSILIHSLNCKHKFYQTTYVPTLVLFLIVKCTIHEKFRL